MNEYPEVKDYLQRVYEEHGTQGLQMLLDDTFKNHSNIHIKVIDYEA